MHRVPIMMGILFALSLSHGRLLFAQGIQDLLGGREESDREEASSRIRRVVDRNRTDLFLSANVVPTVTDRDRGGGQVGIEANLDLDFICGQFDLRGTFKNLLGKEVREEFLEGIIGYVESEITGSAMELLCQAQPTLCTLLQNHNIAANIKMTSLYDRCAAIENAIDHAHKRVYAGAIEQCLREKRAAGVPLDVALNACRRAEQVRGFQGEAIAEFDLGRELRKLVGLSEEGQELLNLLAEDTRYGGTWASSKPDANAVARRHERIKSAYLERWKGALEKEAHGEPLTEEELTRLAPSASALVTRDELSQIVLLPPYKREAIIGSLTSAAALPELTREIHEVERALEAVAGAPTIEEGQRRMLEDRLKRLRNERARLVELYQDQEFYNDARRRVKAILDQESSFRRRRQKTHVFLERGRKGLSASIAAYGQIPVPPARMDTRARGGSPQGGRGCASSCVQLEYQFGSVGGSQ